MSFEDSFWVQYDDVMRCFSKSLDKAEKIARRANQKSTFILLTAMVLLGVIATSDEVVFKRRNKEGD